jgi:hypothetical protein
LGTTAESTWIHGGITGANVTPSVISMKLSGYYFSCPSTDMCQVSLKNIFKNTPFSTGPLGKIVYIIGLQRNFKILTDVKIRLKKIQSAK